MSENKNELELVKDLEGVNMTPEVLVADDFAQKYAKLCAWVEQATKVKDIIDAGIKEIVKANYLETGDSSIKNGEYMYTYVPETESTTLDSKRLKEEHPEIYVEYSRKSKRKDSIRKTKIKTEEKVAVEISEDF